MAGRAEPRLVLRPLRRPRELGRQLRRDNADIDGDGVPDYRIPNIWEYSGTPLAANHPGFGSAR